MKNGGGQNGARSGCIRLQEPPVVSFDLVCLFHDMITPPQLTVGHNLPRVCCLWALMAEQEGRPVPRLATLLPRVSNNASDVGLHFHGCCKPVGLTQKALTVLIVGSRHVHVLCFRRHQHVQAWDRFSEPLLGDDTPKHHFARLVDFLA